MSGWPPKKNTALTIVLPIFDADGDLVSSAAGLDSEVSKDGGSFNDCSNEASEIGSSGMYSLALTADEMNADVVAVIVKTSTSGAKTTPIVLYTDSKQVGDVPTKTEIADEVLSRPISNVEGSAGFRTLCGAVAKLVNKVAISGSTLTVYKTNDSDAMGTQAVTTDADAEPVVGVDTA